MINAYYRENAINKALRFQDEASNDGIVAHESGEYNEAEMKLFDDEIHARTAYFEKVCLHYEIGKPNTLSILPHVEGPHSAALNEIKKSDKWFIIQNAARQAEAAKIAKAREEVETYVSELMVKPISYPVVKTHRREEDKWLLKRDDTYWEEMSQRLQVYPDWN